MTRKWGRAEDAWRVALILRQKSGGLDGETCEKCMKREDEKGVRALIVAHPKGYDPTRIPTLDELALWHQSCNIKALSPHPQVVPHHREREGGAPTPTLTQIHGSQSEKSAIMRARWLAWIEDTQGEIEWQGRSSPTEKGGPFFHFQLVSIKSLTKWAPRALARLSMGETSLGVPQSYEDYVEMDSSEFGGPLRIFIPETGELKGVLCVEYVRHDEQMDLKIQNQTVQTEKVESQA